MNKPHGTNAEVTPESSELSGRRSFMKHSVLAAGVVAAAGLAAASPSEAGQQKQAVQKQLPQRGSEMLLQRLGSSGKTYSKKDLRQVLGVAKKYQVKLVNWCQFGQPAIDGVCGTFEARPELAGRILEDLLKLSSVLRFRICVFPLGIPAVDMVRLKFGAGRLGVEGGVIVDG